VLAGEKVQRRIGRIEIAAQEPIGALLVQHQKGDIAFRRSIAGCITIAAGNAPETIRIVPGHPVNHLICGAGAHGLARTGDQRFDILIGGAKDDETLR
jgi:hypothetical protein